MYVRMHVYMCVCVQVCVCVYVRMYVCMYVCMYVRVCRCVLVDGDIYRHVPRDVHVFTSRRSQRLDLAPALSHLPELVPPGSAGSLLGHIVYHRVLRTVRSVCMPFITSAAANCIQNSGKFWHCSRSVSGIVRLSASIILASCLLTVWFSRTILVSEVGSDTV